MPSSLFIVLVVLFFVASFVFPYIVPRLKRASLRIDAPDTALALFALSLALVLMWQQTTGYQYGVVYQVASNSARDMFGSRVSYNTILNEVGGIVVVVYWFFFASVLFFMAAIIRGTIRKDRTRESVKEAVKEALREDRQEHRVEDQAREAERDNRLVSGIVQGFRGAFEEDRKLRIAPTTKPKDDTK